MAVKILGVGGSLREGSYSTRTVRLCLDMAAARGAETRLLDLRTAGLPMYQPDEVAAVESVLHVGEAVQWADAFLLGTPDYHGSMSGAMKNFLDYHWAEFAGKLFGYVCASHEKGLTVMDQLRTAVRQCYGWSLPYGLSISRRARLRSGGRPDQLAAVAAAEHAGPRPVGLWRVAARAVRPGRERSRAGHIRRPLRSVSLAWAAARNRISRRSLDFAADGRYS